MLLFATGVAVFLLYLLCLLLVQIKPLSKPMATVILIVKNNENCIEGVLRNLFNLQQQHSYFEIIVIDKNSFDQTPLILMKLSTEFNFKFYEINHKNLNPLDLGIIHATCNTIYYMELDNNKKLNPAISDIYKEIQFGKLYHKKTITRIKKLEN